MPRPRIAELPTMALVIEVIEADTNREWFAMATEWERILLELKNAPVAAAITVYEWHLAFPVNPGAGVFTKCPTWKRIRAVPWSLERSDG